MTVKKQGWVRKRLVAIIKPKPKASISTGAPMPGGRIMKPDGSIEKEERER